MSKQASKENNLAIHSPKFIREWHPTKNGSLTPQDFCPYSNKKVWWLCTRDRTHAWEARIAPRHNGVGCPYCSGKVVNAQNCLATLKPGLAKEWHPTKNGALTPGDVTPGSDKKVWWLCKRDKTHEWKALIRNRTKGSGCPFCSGTAVTIHNCLATINPKLAEEWHPTKNGSLTPFDVFPGSHKKAWWLCKNGHEWEADLSNRAKGTGCKLCYLRSRYKQGKG